MYKKITIIFSSSFLECKYITQYTVILLVFKIYSDIAKTECVRTNITSLKSFVYIASHKNLKKTKQTSTLFMTIRTSTMLFCIRLMEAKHDF